MPETISKAQLQELIRHITQIVLKEFAITPPSGGRDEEETNSANDNKVAIDDLPLAARAKMKREKEMQRRNDIKQKEKELDVAKKEGEFQKQKLDASKRFAIPNLTKDIQALKGAKI